MLKRTILLSFVALLMLAACAQSTQAPSSTQALSPTQPTSSTQPPSSTQQVVSGEPAGAECRVVAGRQPNPTLEALLPPPTDKDWVRGPATADVTLIEYSDFQ